MESAPLSSIRVHYATEDGTSTTVVEMPDTNNWSAWLEAIRDSFQRDCKTLLPDNFDLCDLSGRTLGAEILASGGQIPSEIRIRGNTKVRIKCVPTQKVGQIEITVNKIEHINTLEELLENSMEGIRSIQRQSPSTSSFRGKISATLMEDRFLFSDNGCGINAEEIERAISFGDPRDRKEGEGEGLPNILEGCFGRYGTGLKCIWRFGVEQKDQIFRIFSKEADAEHMLFAEQNYKVMFSTKEYMASIEHNPALDSRFFTLNEKATCEQPEQVHHFVGSHGTVIECTHLDPNYFRKLCAGTKDKVKFKHEHLKKLASKYYFYTNPAAFASIRKVILQVGKEVRPEGTEVFLYALKESSLPSCNWGPIDITINQQDLNSELDDNIVQNRVLDLLAAGDSAVRDNASKSILANLSFTNEETEKNCFSRVYKVLLYFDARVDEEEEECRDKEEDEQGAEDQRKLLVLWNGILMHSEEKFSLPWIESAKRNAPARNKLLQEAFANLRGLVMVGGDFAPDANKTNLSKERALNSELKKMSNATNKRVKNRLADDLLEQVTTWSQEVNKAEQLASDHRLGRHALTAVDAQEHYGKVTKQLSDGTFEREYAMIEEAGASGRGGRRAGKPSASSQTYRAPTDAGPGTFVEIDISQQKGPSRQRGSGKGATTVFGFVAAVITAHEDKSGRAGKARIEVPFAEPLTVHLSKIIRCVPDGEKEGILAKAKERLPHAIELWVHMPEAANASEEKKEALEIQFIGGAPYRRVAPEAARERDEVPTWTLTLEQVSAFQVLAQVVDCKGRVVEHGGTEGHSKSSSINLKKLPCRFTLHDEQNVGIRRQEEDEDWEEHMHPYGESARYMTEMPGQTKRGLKPLNNYLSDRKDIQEFRVRAHVNFDQQRRSVQDYIERQHPNSGLAGLSCTMAVRVVPGKPCRAQITAEEAMWLAEKRFFPMKLVDREGLEVPSNAVKDVSCVVPGSDFRVLASVQGAKCVVEIEGKERSSSSDDPVTLQFRVETSWEDPSSAGHLLCVSSSAETFLTIAKTVVMSGLPYSLQLEDPSLRLQNLARMKPLTCQIRVLDLWNNEFRGRPGALTLRLELKPSDGMLDWNGGTSKLEILEYESGVVQLPAQLKAVVCGDFGSQGVLQAECSVTDVRPQIFPGRQARAVKHEPVNSQVVLQVEGARLVFVVTGSAAEDCLGSMGEAVNLAVNSRQAAELRTTVQVQQPSGSVMSEVASSEDDQLFLYKLRPGTKDKVDEKQLEIVKGQADVDPQFLDCKESFDYVAEYCGLTAKLSLALEHGSSALLRVDQQRTEKKAAIGAEWSLFFRVTDENEVAISQACFDVVLQCDYGIKFACVDNSLTYVPEHGVFMAKFVPLGKLTGGSKVKIDIFLGNVQNEALDTVELELATGAATGLHFVREDQVGYDSPYTSGKALNLSIAAMDDHANVDGRYEGQITVVIAEDPGDEELFHEELKVKHGIARVPKEKTCFFTRAAALKLSATTPVKKTKVRGSRPSVPRLEAATCTLAVSKGEWPSNIEIHHPQWDPRRNKLVIDDSATEVVGLTARVIADSGEAIQHANLVLIANETKTVSRTSESDAELQQFQDCPFPKQPGGYDARLELVEDSSHSAMPKLMKQFSVLRQAGSATEAVLKVWMDKTFRNEHQDATIVADTPFYAEVHVLNRLKQPISRHELDNRCTKSGFQYFIEFVLDEAKSGLVLNYDKLEDDPTSLRYKITLSEVEPLQTNAVINVKGIAHVEGHAIESSTSFKVSYVPAAQRKRSAEALEQKIKEKNKLGQALSQMQKDIQDCEEVVESKTATNNKAEGLLSECKPMADLRSDLRGLERQQTDMDKSGVRLSEPNLCLSPHRSLEAFLKAKRVGKLPTDVCLIGIAGELGYVNEVRIARGIEVAAGNNLQALVVASEADFDAIENEKGRLSVLQGMCTVVMSKDGRTPRLDNEGFFVFTEPPQRALPQGACYAVNQIRFDHLPSTLCAADVKQRLRSELWWNILGSTIIFSSMQDMQGFKAQHGRRHVLAAPRPDGTWSVIKSRFAIPGHVARPFVKLSIACPVTDTEEYKKIVLDMKEATENLSRRKNLEDECEKTAKELQSAKQALKKAENEYSQEEPGQTSQIQALEREINKLSKPESESIRGKGKQARAEESQAEESPAKKSRRGRGMTAADGAQSAVGDNDAVHTPQNGKRGGPGAAPTETPSTSKKARVANSPPALTRSSSRTRASGGAGARR